MVAARGQVPKAILALLITRRGVELGLDGREHGFLRAFAPPVQAATVAVGALGVLHPEPVFACREFHLVRLGRHAVTPAVVHHFLVVDEQLTAVIRLQFKRVPSRLAQ